MERHRQAGVSVSPTTSWRTASYARGYKAGGFNLDRERTTATSAHNPAHPAAPIAVDIDTSFDKELVDSYELGMKTQWAGQQLLLNGAVFYQDYTDFQLNTFTGMQFVVTSLPQVVSQGVDIDMVWYTPLEQLSLQGGVTYAETPIEDFGTAAGVLPSGARERHAVLRAGVVGQPVGDVRAADRREPAVPRQRRRQVHLRVQHRLEPGSAQDPGRLTLVNARLGFGAADERWMVEAWAQNLTDEEYYQVAFDATLQGSSAGAVPTSTIDAFLGAPRTYGLTARFKF